MERRACTARVPSGRTRTRPCRNVAPCTHVRILNAAGDVLQDRWVCPTCRQRMRLPEHDVDFRPGQTEVSDQIVDDLADFGEVEYQAAADDLAAKGSAEGFRLP